jgi:hypothetical protein
LRCCFHADKPPPTHLGARPKLQIKVPCIPPYAFTILSGQDMHLRPNAFKFVVNELSIAGEGVWGAKTKPKACLQYGGQAVGFHDKVCPGVGNAACHKVAAAIVFWPRGLIF